MRNKNYYSSSRCIKKEYNFAILITCFIGFVHVLLFCETRSKRGVELFKGRNLDLSCHPFLHRRDRHSEKDLLQIVRDIASNIHSYVCTIAHCNSGNS